MNIKRLEKLADFLETVPRRSFDMGNWQSRAATKPEGKQQGECGFAGCAMGWAAHAKLFRGLNFKNAMSAYGNGPLGWQTISYRGLTDFYAAAFLMDITYAEARFLFDPDSYPSRVTPKQVATRIRRYIKSNGEMNAH